MGLETENHILTLGLDPEEWWEVWRCEGIKGKQLITHYVGRDSAAEELLVCDPLSPDSDVVFFGYSFIQYPLGTHRDCSVCWVLAAKLLSQIAKHVWFHAGYLQHYNQAMNTSQPITDYLENRKQQFVFERPSFLSTSIPISLALERPRCCDHGRTLTTCAAKNFRDTLTKTLFWIVLWRCFKTWSTCTPTVSLDTCIGFSDCFHQDLAMVAHWCPLYKIGLTVLFSRVHVDQKAKT